jgi:hypothetical protein
LAGPGLTPSDLDDLHKHVRDLALKDFITAQEKFSFMCFLMIDFDSFKRILKLLVSLKKKSGKSDEKPPNDSKTIEM